MIDRRPLIDQDEIDAVVEVLKSRELDGFRGSPGEAFLGGTKVREFERKFADKFGVKHAVSFNSCTSALHAACVSIGIEQGDEVLVSPYTMTSSAKCVLMAGGKPKFVDIDPDYFCIDPELAEWSVSPRTKAIIPVHLCGQPADMSRIMQIAKKHNLKVIEDSAQAIGSTYHGIYTGTIGDCGVFSFGAPKTLTTGTGGMLVTNNDSIWDKATKVRNHGEMCGDMILGFNYRMTEIQAAIGIVQLNKLEWQNDTRITLANRLSMGLEGTGLIPPKVREGCKHVYYTYPVKVTNRKKICTELTRKGFYLGEGYSVPLNRIPLYKTRIKMPVAEEMYDSRLAVTDILKPPMTIDDVDKMVEVIHGLVS